MSDVMIAAQGLTKRYGQHRALENASFEVKKGEIVGLLGPNGAGKSTTMKILTCYIAPSDGTAKINGCDIWDDPVGARAAIGYLPESTALYGEMLVAEYLEWAAEMRGLKGPALAKAVKRVVHDCALSAFYAQEIRTLSKGQKQRVGIAQALIHEPPILILDEPMSGLDPNQVIEIRDLIKRLGAERTVILSLHNLAEVQATCQRVLIINNGKIIADDTPEALTARAGKRYVVTLVNHAKAKETLAKVRGVDVVRVLDQGSSTTTFEVLPKSKDDLSTALYDAVVAAGLSLKELRTQAQSLEQVFRELTIGDEEDEDDEEEEAPKPAAKSRLVEEDEKPSKAEEKAESTDAKSKDASEDEEEK
jgi:ABC-2 type transport system ATP-binding protein